jgi:hypothetical protein
VFLIPPGQIKGYAAEYAPDQGAIGGRELAQHQRRLVRRERVQRQREVDTPVQRRALLLNCLHRTHGRSAQQDSQLRPLAGTIPEGAQYTRQLRGDPQQFGKLVEHQQQALIGGGRREALQRVVPVHEGPCGEVAYPRRQHLVCGSAEDAQLIARGPSRAGVKHRTAIFRKRAQQRGLAHSSSSPHERNAPRPREVLPPPDEGLQLCRPVDEHEASITDMQCNRHAM